MFTDIKTAIVVDALPALGGAEKVLLATLDLFPSSTIFTLYYNQQEFEHTPLTSHRVVTSFVNSLPMVSSHYRYYLPIMPFAIERFNLHNFDLVLSFSYAVAHGVRLKPGQIHLSYLYTPMRYAWRNFRLNGSNGSSPGLLSILLAMFRRWDRAAASGVSHFAAVSGWIAEWAQRAYHRSAEVIYPPVDIDRFTPAAQRGNYFISVARLVPHKRIDLLVEAFNTLKLPLYIVGQGPTRKMLERRSGPNIRFLGYQPDSVVNELLNHARAFISCGEEDFGTAIVEAQSAGCPVIAYAGGGACEIVISGRTGILFHEQNAGNLIQAVETLLSNQNLFNPADCVENARRFGKKRFLAEFSDFVTRNTTAW